MKIANAGRIMFYHRTDVATAGRILRDGFIAEPAATYELSLEPTAPMRGSAILRIAVPLQVAEAVLKGPSQSLMGALREYFVCGASLQACRVSIVSERQTTYATG
jgi:hypothetical protein